MGYRGYPLPGLPVDERTGTVPNEAGRVLRDGHQSPGEYVAGWIKRGPTGVVGTNKHDAHETVAALLDDVADGLLPVGGPVDDLVDTLRARGLRAGAARQLAGHRRGRGRARRDAGQAADDPPRASAAARGRPRLDRSAQGRGPFAAAGT